MSTYAAKGSLLMAFCGGAIVTCVLFKFNLLGGALDTDLIALANRRQFECKSQTKVDDEKRLEAIMMPVITKDTRPNDQRLLSVIRDHFIEYPRPWLTKMSLPLYQTPQAKEVDLLLKQKQGGFFVECGALDGERSSNTNWLEQKRGWNGLLVEMDPSYYMQLRGKNRKCISINACLSPETYPVQMDFKEHHMGEGRLVTNDKTRTANNAPIIHKSYCFPLHSIMLALNRTKIDYFSLDVEGMELPILRTIPFDELDISVLSVEYVHGAEGAKAYKDFMESKGYYMHKQIRFIKPEIYLGVNDYIFIKKSLL